MTLLTFLMKIKPKSLYYNDFIDFVCSRHSCIDLICYRHSWWHCLAERGDPSGSLKMHKSQ
jgi:hypothetical protein